MSYIPGDVFNKQFVTFNVSGVSTNMDSLPTGIMIHNGFDDYTRSAQVYFKNVDIGRYNASGTIPSTYVAGDDVLIAISGYMGGSLTKSIIDLGQLDNSYNWTSTERSQLRYKIGIDGTATAPVSAYAGHMELSVSGLRNIVVEPGVNAQQLLSLMGAAIAGSSVVNGQSITYYAVNNNATTRIVSTAVSGSRQSILLTLP